MNDNLLSACMIVRNESGVVGKAIQSLRGLADEVIVVDTGSTDDTPLVSQRAGAKVFHSPWRDDFAYHRNESIAYATGKWVLIIDADETVEAGDFADTRRRLAANGLPDVLMVKHWSTYPGGDRVLEYLPRILRKSAPIRYQHRLHEQLTVNGNEALLSNVVMSHQGYEQAERLSSKNERNARIAALMPDDEPHTHHCRMRAQVALNRWDDAKESAQRLLTLPNIPDAVAYDAHVVLAAAHFRLPQEGGAHPEFHEHLQKARTIDPYAPDVPYLEMLSAATNYLAALDLANAPGSQTFLRIGHFWRAGTQVREAVRVMAGGPLTATWARGQSVPPGRSNAMAEMKTTPRQPQRN
ncbi:MAG: glycosyltransferase family 2 protein [Myxococcales bacterium]|nr:glycosyltransferase family 2 protein [Myxococcales bacterium]